MEIAFFSDIHGNIDALRAAVNEAKEKGINKFIALGDYVGYYYCYYAFCFVRLPQVETTANRGGKMESVSLEAKTSFGPWCCFTEAGIIDVFRISWTLSVSEEWGFA